MPINNDGARQRVKIIRYAFCKRDENGKPETAKAFATRLGIEETAWNNFEKRGRPGLDNAVRLIEEFSGLTLDYLYLGDKSGVAVAIQRELTMAERELAAQEPVVRSSERTKVKTGRAGRPARSPSSKASTISRA